MTTAQLEAFTREAAELVRQSDLARLFAAWGRPVVPEQRESES